MRSAGLPNITYAHYMRTATGNIDILMGYDGALRNEDHGQTKASQLSFSGEGTDKLITFDASRSSTIYGNSYTVQPPAITANFLIKY